MKSEAKDFAIIAGSLFVALILYYMVFVPYVMPQVDKLFGKSAPAKQG